MHILYQTPFETVYYIKFVRKKRKEKKLMPAIKRSNVE